MNGLESVTGCMSFFPSIKLLFAPININRITLDMCAQTRVNFPLLSSDFNQNVECTDKF
jgi:hypothetical protein